MRPRLLAVALLLLALPTPDAAALGLEVAPLPPVPTDGTPFEVAVTLTDLPEDPVEVKAWIGDEVWQASRTWNGSAWIRADRYALAPPSGQATWQTWLRLQVNPEARHHPDLTERASALLGLRVRQGDQVTTWHRPVDLLHEPEHRPVGLNPGQVATASGPDGRLLARTHNPGPVPAVADLAVPAGHPVSVCVADRCHPRPGLHLAAVGEDRVALRSTAPEPVELASAILATEAWRCPLEGRVSPGQARLVPLGPDAPATGCPAPADPGTEIHLLDLGTRVDQAEIPTWGWRARYPEASDRWAPRPLPTGAWPARPDPLQVDGAGDAFGTREQGLTTVLEVIDGARDRLTVASYLLTHGLVADALARAAQRGVDVDLVLEPDPIGGRPALGDRLVEELRSAGVTVRWSQGPWSQRGFQHAKVLVADGYVALVLTENLTRSGLPADGDGNLGLGIGIANRTLAHRLEGLFGRQGPATPWQPGGWAPFSGQVTVLTSPENTWSPDGVLARLARTDGPIRGLSLTASPTTGRTPNPILDALVDASERVPVKVLLNGVGHEDRVDDANRPALAYLVAHPARGDLEARLSTPAQGKVHAKALVGPGWVMVGSSNWGSGGLVVNREVNLLVEDPAFAQELAGVFDEAWGTHAGPVRPTATVAAPLVLAVLALAGQGMGWRRRERTEGRAGSAYGRQTH